MSTDRETSSTQRDDSGDEPEIDATEGRGEAEESSGSGMDSNVAGALSYLLGPLTGILFYLLEDDDEFVRFHGAQSTIVFGGLFALSIGMTALLTVLAVIPIVGWIAGAVLGFASLLLAPVAFVAWLFLMYKAYRGIEYEVPIAGEYARKYAPPR